MSIDNEDLRGIIVGTIIFILIALSLICILLMFAAMYVQRGN